MQSEGFGMTTQLKSGRGIDPYESAAARRVFEDGGSPRAQIEAVRRYRESVGNTTRVGYLPHAGKRERDRARRRMEKS